MLCIKRNILSWAISIRTCRRLHGDGAHRSGTLHPDTAAVDAGLPDLLQASKTESNGAVPFVLTAPFNQL